MADQPLNSQPLQTGLVRAPQMSRMTLRVNDDSLDVAIVSKVEDNSLIYRHIPYTATATSAIRALEEAVYDNPLLLSDFGQIDILFDTPRFIVIPEERADDDRAEEMLETLYPDIEFEPVTSRIPGGAVIAAAVNADIERFAGRTFADARRMHRIVPLCRYFGARNRSGNGGRIHVHLRPGFTDVIAYLHGRTMMANTFSSPSGMDALYYILAAAQNLRFDDSCDRMIVSGDNTLRDTLMPMLRKYYPHAMPAIFPSAMLRAGAAAMQAPFEMLAIPLCE